MPPPSSQTRHRRDLHNARTPPAAPRGPAKMIIATMQPRPGPWPTGQPVTAVVMLWRCGEGVAAGNAIEGAAALENSAPSIIGETCRAASRRTSPKLSTAFTELRQAHSKYIQ